MRTVYLNIATLVTGAALLSFAFDWKIGIGTACLVYFLKTPE